MLSEGLDWYLHARTAVEEGCWTVLLAQGAAKLLEAHDGRDPVLRYPLCRAVQPTHCVAGSCAEVRAHRGHRVHNRASPSSRVWMGARFSRGSTADVPPSCLVMFTADNIGTRITNSGRIAAAGCGFRPGSGTMGLLPPARPVTRCSKRWGHLSPRGTRRWEDRWGANSRPVGRLGDDRPLSPYPRARQNPLLRSSPDAG